MGDLTKNFSRKEFACKCGCGFDDINLTVVKLCQEIRDALDEPLKVNSGCRCEAHNATVGSTSRNHVNGNAADLTCRLGHKVLWELALGLYTSGKLQELKLCLQEGSWVHIDVDRDRANSVFQKL